MYSTAERSYKNPRNAQPFRDYDVAKLGLDGSLRQLNDAGIGMSDRVVHDMANSSTLRLITNAANAGHFAMDAIQPSITTQSLGTPIQFLQNWLPGFVYVLTGARNIDDFIGMSMTGSWIDAEVVQGVLERLGTVQPYSDNTNVPLSNFNVNWERRTVIQFESGMQVGALEAERAARERVNVADILRQANALELEIERNRIGFYGYNNGANRTYGFLNDPNLPSYITVPNGASGSPLWSRKTFLEIIADIQAARAALRTNSQDRINPDTTPLTLAVATAAVDALGTPSQFGESVKAYLAKSYPNIRVVSAPELNAANSSANVFYLFADRLDDESTDDGRIWLQPVQAKFQVLGVEQRAKSYVEDYLNATAGVMLKRPYGVYRASGV